MNKRFWKTASAVAAAVLTLTLGACSKVTTDENDMRFTEENNTRLAVNVTKNSKDYNQAYDKAFEASYQKQLAREDFEEREKQAAQGLVRDPHDVARDIAARTAHAECEKLDLCNILELEPVKNTEYKTWEGTFEVDDIKDAAVYLLPSHSKFSCSVGDTTASMTARYGYDGNYKEANVELTYADGTVSQNHMNLNNETLAVSAPEKDGTIEKASYELTIFSGDGDRSEKMETVRVTLVKK